jgi:hypothetical protein
MKEILHSFHLVVIYMLCIWIASCHKSNTNYGFNFEQEWEWKSLEGQCNKSGTLEKIESLKATLSIEETRALLLNLSRLNTPEDIVGLFEIQSMQDALGGGFYGIAPELSEISDSIPIPSDFDKLISAGLFLAQFRISTYQAIANTGYPLDFSDENLQLRETETATSNIELVFDFSPVKRTLDAFKTKTLTLKEASEISQLSGFEQMLAHRRNLGYIPEPLPNQESLAQFIFYASRDEPIHNLWKWLSPWNYFNFSDLYLNQKDYQGIIQELERNEEEIAGFITNRIHPFVPDDFYFRDTLTFAVNWGIRSWATANTLGTNIVQFKDHFDLLLETISHETFHRIQLELCPRDSAHKEPDKKAFEDILSYPFANGKDAKFYEVLSYIFLEGTASYIGGSDTFGKMDDNVRTGRDLLYEIYTEIYMNNNTEAVEALLNKGLRSNGPFYALGCKITEQLVLHSEPEAIRNLLLNGTLNFFRAYFQLDSEAGVLLDNNTKNKVLELVNHKAATG